MLKKLIYTLSGERMLFNTSIPWKYRTGKVLSIKLGRGTNALFRVSRVLKSKPIHVKGSASECYEVWGREESTL